MGHHVPFLYQFSDIYLLSQLKLELSENLTIAPLHCFSNALLYTICIWSNKKVAKKL